MNREIERLARALDGIGDQSPGWDAPAGVRDVMAEEIFSEMLGLGAGGLRAVGAAVRRRRLPVICRFSVRVASRATSAAAPQRCKAALAAAVVAEWDEREPRELMINLAPHHVAATRAGGHAAALFDWAAGRAAPDIAETLRVFGTRTDVGLEAFGWKEVTSQGATWFVLGGQFQDRRLPTACGRAIGAPGHRQDRSASLEPPRMRSGRPALVAAQNNHSGAITATA